MVGSPGFEPGSREPESMYSTAASVNSIHSGVDWVGFRRWLFETHRHEWAGRLYYVARKYCAVLWLSGEASRLSGLSGSGRRLALASLTNLSRFLGVYRRSSEQNRKRRALNAKHDKKKNKKARLGVRFGELREYWASVMTRHLSQPEIDFLQGRVSTSVFMRNYFNPAWISDLKQRTIEASEEILEKIEFAEARSVLE